MPDITDNESFITLIELAKDPEDEIGRQIRSLILLEKEKRTFVLERLIKDMQRGDAPEELIEALSYLSDETIVQKVKSLL